MIIYTYSDARQNFSKLLKEAQEFGSVMIKRQDGSKFIVTPFQEDISSLDVEGINIDISRKDIIEAIRTTRGNK